MNEITDFKNDNSKCCAIDSPVLLKKILSIAKDLTEQTVIQIAEELSLLNMEDREKIALTLNKDEYLRKQQIQICL
jgi:hypothetical protein